MRRPRAVVVLITPIVIALSLASTSLHARASAPVVVTVRGAEIRVQVSEGLTRPCDSGNDRMLFDGRLKPGETFRGAITSDCICVRHTSPGFRDVDWSESGLIC